MKSYISLVLFFACSVSVSAQTLPNTEKLAWTENPAVRNTRLITEFLDKKIEQSVEQRAKHWNRQFDDRATYGKSVGANRKRFRFIIGVRDERVPFESPELVETLDKPALLSETDTHKIYKIRWAVFETLNGEGILYEPQNGKPTSTVISIPDTDNTLRFVSKAVNDVRYIFPVIVDRKLEKRGGRAVLTNREYIYRAAYQLGRHIIGYEVQEILALVDWIKKNEPNAPVYVEGYGEGGLLAFYAAAADTRIDEVSVAGYFGNRDRVCDEPIDRNVFGLLDQFGDAEIATLIAPRKLTIIGNQYPQLVLKSENGGAPGTLKKQSDEAVKAEIERAKKLVEPFNDWITLETANGVEGGNEGDSRSYASTDAAITRLVRGMDRHTQNLLNRAELTRREFWKKLDTTSPEKIAGTIEWYRNYFAKEVIGQFDDQLVEPKPRTRLYREEKTHTVYEVELDVFSGITVYGLLCIPKGLKDGEKLPVVVCQPGLECEPNVTLRTGDPGCAGYLEVLCERGYVTFAPQGIFAGKDKFRFNQRQLNPLGKTLFSIMVPQHQQLVNWLGTLSFVDKNKIGLYGISYGGKTAMRVPPLVKDYALSVCSADFNSWNVKNVSTLYPFSYVWINEYEIFEFDLANTFDYSDMARLIAPRPFMVERGHLDGVGWSEFVGFEFGKVRYYYDHYLKIPERAEIHWFDGGHQINGEKTYPFLDRWLK